MGMTFLYDYKGRDERERLKGMGKNKKQLGFYLRLIRFSVKCKYKSMYKYEHEDRSVMGFKRKSSLVQKECLLTVVYIYSIHGLLQILDQIIYSPYFTKLLLLSLSLPFSMVSSFVSRKSNHIMTLTCIITCFELRN